MNSDSREELRSDPGPRARTHVPGEMVSRCPGKSVPDYAGDSVGHSFRLRKAGPSG